MLVVIMQLRCTLRRQVVTQFLKREATRGGGCWREWISADIVPPRYQRVFLSVRMIESWFIFLESFDLS